MTHKRLLDRPARAALLGACAGLCSCGPGAAPADSGANGSSSGTVPTTPTTLPQAPDPAAATPSTPAPDAATGPIPANVTQRDLQAAASAANQFAFDLFRRAAPAGENAVISPLNVRHALALAWAGAGGRTQQAMAGALRFSGPEDREHALLAGLVASALAGQGDEAPEVAFASRLWVQDDLPLAEGYRPRLESAYATALDTIDFPADPEGARRTINAWVAQQTRDRIPEVLPGGSVHADTRLVLTSAVYLKARWASPFEKEATWNGAFTLGGGEAIDVPMMHHTAHRDHAITESYTAVELGYEGSTLAMLLVMPTVGTLDAFEGDLDAAAWEAIVGGLGAAQVRLAMPKFEFDTASDLADPLKEMGMEVAFSDRADFSRMVDREALMIDGVHHGAFLRVDEAGTEAAAATAITMAPTSAPAMDEPVEISIDRPFMLAIRDRQTGAVLFLGRVVDPR